MNQQLKVHLALFSVALIYAANYSIAKTVMPVYVKPFGLIVIRVVSAAVFFGILSREGTCRPPGGLQGRSGGD